MAGEEIHEEEAKATIERLAYARSIGYSMGDMAEVPEGASISHGCGHPTALADLKEGEVVVDLGAGAGLDAFLAAGKVGATGWVIGVDSAADRVETANACARGAGHHNVEFRVGRIERLPVVDECADVVISNCVINHSAHKEAVFREAYRVLKPEGRLMVCDLVIVGEMTEAIRRQAGPVWAEWLANACGEEAYLRAVRQAGFQSVAVAAEGTFPMAEADDALRGRILSLRIRAEKL